LIVKMQESADQNLGSIRTQLTIVVADLAEKVGSLSREMMEAAGRAATQAQRSATEVLDRTGEWSEATTARLEKLVAGIESRSVEFKTAGDSLLRARDLLVEVISANSKALDRMAEASRQVQAYSTSLAGQSDALKALNQAQAQVTAQLREAAAALQVSSERNETLMAEHRHTFDGYKKVVDGLDQDLSKILKAIHAGLRDYNQSIENNFREIVKISNPMISEASGLLRAQIEELSEQLEELGSVIASSVERVNGRAR
jgi:chromosome segregation ATPase